VKRENLMRTRIVSADLLGQKLTKQLRYYI
jgi:hypothetical protein